ncbi:MAG TPA: nicotinamide riboside transporter PnuC [Bacteroidia bacterium]|nr:nicotinamide riboside transporter PnuC [Bacteroidia bacterium]
MLEAIRLYITQSYLELIAVILSIAGVWLTAKEKVINWPIAIIACAIYVYIFFKDNLFGDASLQIFYVIISFYGWYEWLYGGKNHKELFISRTPLKLLIVLALISIPLSICLGFIISYTKSTVPYWDGITTGLSLLGTWMMAKKYIEHWLVWIITDILYIALYIIKELYLTAVLSLIFTLLAVYGYYAWKKQITVSFA